MGISAPDTAFPLTLSVFPSNRPYDSISKKIQNLKYSAQLRGIQRRRKHANKRKQKGAIDLIYLSFFSIFVSFLMCDRLFEEVRWKLDGGLDHKEAKLK